jgi:hypothetical protein
VESLEPRCLLSATALPTDGTGVTHAELPTFQSREELQSFLYGDIQARYESDFGQPRECSYRIGEDYYPVGWPGDVIYRSDNLAMQSSASNAPSDVTASGTNNQVAGVDEADQVKSDGEYIYLLSGNELVIVRSWPVVDFNVVSRTALPGTPLVQFLNGDRLTVISSAHGQDTVHGTDGDAFRWWNRVGVTVLDISDRAHPQIIGETLLDGNFNRALMVGEQVQLVVSNSINTSIWSNYYGECYPIWYFADALPGQPAVSPPILDGSSMRVAPSGSMAPDSIWMPNYLAWLDPRRTTTETRTEFDDYTEVTRHTTFESWADYDARVFSGADPLDLLAPGMYQRGGADGQEMIRQGLVSDPDDIVRPANLQSTNLITVATFNVTASQPATVLDTASIFAGWDASVYESHDHLYITSSRYDHPNPAETVVHQFLVEPASVTVTAEGHVPGTVLNQFSLDEHAGHFRLVTNSWDGTISNNLFVLDTEGLTLDVVGQMTGLAHNERIMSARFLGDRAYVVTFLRTDPLFVFDLSQPANPRVLGELVIPGFSDYLQPIDATHLLGIGQNGWGGLQVSLFDVSNDHEPQLVDRIDVAVAGRWNWNSLGGPFQFDSHAVSFFADQGILAIPVNRYSYSWMRNWIANDGLANGLLLLHVDATGIQKLGEIAHGLPVQRSLRIGDLLYSISQASVWGWETPANSSFTIKVHELANPSVQVAELSLANGDVSAHWTHRFVTLLPIVVPSVGTRGLALSSGTVAMNPLRFVEDAVQITPESWSARAASNRILRTDTLASVLSFSAIRVHHGDVSQSPVPADGEVNRLQRRWSAVQLGQRGVAELADIDQLWTRFGAQLDSLSNPLHDLFDRLDNSRSDEKSVPVDTAHDVTVVRTPSVDETGSLENEAVTTQP